MATKKRTQPSESEPLKQAIANALKGKIASDQAVQIAEFATRAMVAAKQLRIKSKPLENFWLAPAQREVLMLIPGLPRTIRNKLSKEYSLTVSEVICMTIALADDLPAGNSKKQLALLLVAKHLIDRLEEGIKAKAAPPAKNKSKPSTQSNQNLLYQFKITLLESKPSIWRRIQVKDSTLDKFHERIQTAMGWTNSHLHRFEIDGERYGDPELLHDGFEDFECVDSTVTKVSEIVPEDGKRFRFRYEYDFGDSWEHEILFEGCLRAEKGGRYPLCVEGERSCPPEDVGGVCGYAEFLEIIADPKHERHEDFVEWAGDFDPEAFNSGEATKVMRRGLPDWRKYS